MGRRQKRTTRTVRFLGGPLHGELTQLPPNVEVAMFNVGPNRFDHYVGPVGSGAAVFVYTGTHDDDGNLIQDVPEPLQFTTFHVKRDGDDSDEWVDISDGISSITLSTTDGP